MSLRPPFLSQDCMSELGCLDEKGFLKTLWTLRFKCNIAVSISQKILINFHVSVSIAQKKKKATRAHFLNDILLFEADFPWMPPATGAGGRQLLWRGAWWELEAVPRPMEALQSHLEMSFPPTRENSTEQDFLLQSSMVCQGKIPI